MVSFASSHWLVGEEDDCASLMKRSMGLDVLECPKCQNRMQPIANITEQEVIQKILSHLRSPLAGEMLDDGAVVYDITDEPMLEQGWHPGESGNGKRERGPPNDWDGIDEPASDA